MTRIAKVSIGALMTIGLATAGTVATSEPASAGCLTGGAVGGLAGHAVGHGVAGAAAGCAVGHHMKHRNTTTSTTGSRYSPNNSTYDNPSGSYHNSPSTSRY
jgi:hypothetical protein